MMPVCPILAFTTPGEIAIWGIIGGLIETGVSGEEEERKQRELHDLSTSSAILEKRNIYIIYKNIKYFIKYIFVYNIFINL